jgi:hypothetical protein
MAMRAPVALAALAFAASAAWAEERAVVVVDATADGRGAPVVARLNAALGAAPDLAPIAPTLIDALAVATPTDAGPLAAATAALAQAREHMARFASGEALAVAQAAIDAGAAAAGDPEVRAVLAELAFVEGLALADGELAAARPAWTLAHALAPGRTLDPARYPPEQVAAFAAAATPAPGSGAVMIAAPGAAEVLIDGAVIGREPAVAQLAPGPHLVTARGDDIAPVGRRVVAAAGQTVRVDLVPVLEVPTLRAARGAGSAARGGRRRRPGSRRWSRSWPSVAPTTPSWSSTAAPAWRLGSTPRPAAWARPPRSPTIWARSCAPCDRCRRSSRRGHRSSRRGRRRSPRRRGTSGAGRASAWAASGAWSCSPWWSRS